MFLSSSAFCRKRVLLPMPGSPPTSTSEPGTIPPPNTRFNSPSGVNSLSSSLLVTSERFTIFSERLFSFFSSCQLIFLNGTSFCTFSSTNVFHCPQLGHLPAHLADSYPQC